MKKKFNSLYKKDVILDTNTIIDLNELNQILLPCKLFQNVYYSKNAFIEELDEELKRSVETAGYKPICIETNDGYVSLFYLKENHKALSICDKVVISIAAEKKILCCTNDKPARQACAAVDVKPIGTIGILCGCYENGIIKHEELTAIFNKYVYDCSSRLGQDLIDEIRVLYNISDVQGKVIDL